MPWKVPTSIGWWLDNDPITFYHGTHVDNLEWVLEHGLVAPKEGPTAGWVSLALEPFTGRGYAAMSGMGGESSFRAAGNKAKSTPMNQRVVFVLKIPKAFVLKNMAPERGAMQSTKNRLKDKQEYLDWKRTDTEYYALTEIRLPKKVDKKFIVGYMISS